MNNMFDYDILYNGENDAGESVEPPERNQFEEFFDGSGDNAQKNRDAHEDQDERYGFNHHPGAVPDIDHPICNI